MNATSETYPLEITQNTASSNATIPKYNSRDVDGENTEGAYGGGKPKKPTLSRENRTAHGANPSPAITSSTPSRRNAVKNTQRRRTPDLITIYESEDENKYEKDQVDTRAPQQHRPGKGGFRFASAPRVGHRSMTKNGKPPLNAGQKRPPQTNPVDDNDNVRETTRKRKTQHKKQYT